jgi:hypothetical protein
VRLPIALIAVLTLAAGAAGCGGGSSASTTSGSAASTGNAASTGSAASGSAATQPSTASTTGSTQMGFEAVPIEPGPVLAPASTTQTGTVDGISCGPTEQLAYHIHAHLMVYVNGQPRALTGGIGIPGSQVVQSPQGPIAAGGSCIYWLHTHAPDGIIHIESPTQTIYTLGEFFDEWHQPLSKSDVAGVKGRIAAIVNGRPWTGNPRDIPLNPHTVIQLDVGTPKPAFQAVNWSATQL